MAKPEISLIITTYQMPDHLRRVLASVARQTVADNMEIIVSDDGSHDETAHVVQEFSRGMTKPIGFVTQPHNGFHLTRCRNNGARIASAPYLLFLDGDCLIPADHVEQYLLRRRAGYVHFGYCVRLDRESSQNIRLPQIVSGEFTHFASREQLRKLSLLHYKSLFYQWLGHPTKPVLKGGNIGMWRDDFQRLNGFDENYRAWGCEDDDLSYRARQAGLRVASMLGNTRTYHLWHPPAASKPVEKWSDGENIAYFKRTGRLTACLHGMRTRDWSEVKCKVVGDSDWSPFVRRTLQSHFQLANPTEPAEIEVVCQSHGRFTASAACRIVVTPKPERVSSTLSRSAHLILPTDAELNMRIQQFLSGKSIERLQSAAA